MKKLLRYTLILFIAGCITQSLQAQSCGGPLTITPGTPITGANTAGDGSNWNVTPCTDGSSYISDDASEENHIYSYTPAAAEDFTITLSNTSTTWAGVHVTDGCNDASATCLGFASIRDGDPATVTGSFCPGTTYFIAVSTWPTPNTLTYDLSLTTTPGDACSCGTTLRACDDGDPCTINDMETVGSDGTTICVPCAGEALTTANGTSRPCDDGLDCTTGDVEYLGTDGITVCIPCAGEYDGSPVETDLSCGDIVDYPCGPGTYGSNENITWTFTPDAGTYGRIEFTYMDVEASTSGDLCWDEITITGTTTTGPWCGEADGDGGAGSGLVPGSCLYSAVPGGPITINFTSDGTVQETGFTFTVSCESSAAAAAAACPAPSFAPVLLPIELISFTGKVKATSNMIKWVTATESNTAWHILERSENSNNWSELARINAAGESTIEKTYSIEDRNPLTKAYYRLRTIDNDGSESISDLIYLTRDANKFGVHNIAPNPTSSMVSINFESPIETNVRIDVVDVMGRSVISKNYQATKGSNIFEADLSNQSVGVYLISLSNGKETIVKKVVKN